jgi:hypothetical protein
VPRHVARLITRLVAPLVVDFSTSRRLVVDYSAKCRLVVDYSVKRRLVVDYFASAGYQEPSWLSPTALCDAGLRARLGSSLLQVTLPTLSRAQPARRPLFSSFCLFVRAPCRAAVRATTAVLTSVCAARSIAHTRAPVHPHTRTRILGGARPPLFARLPPESSSPVFRPP